MITFRRFYGSNPLHLLAHIGVFFIAGWAISQILGAGSVINWIAWFLGAALLHDLVLLPLYSTIDRGLIATVGAPSASIADEPDGTARRPSPLNHLRVPAAVSAILLLVYFPLILGYASKNYQHDTGHALAGYTRNWLLICAGLFLFSALVYMVRLIRSRPRIVPAADEQPDDEQLGDEQLGD
jgi:hypothetical protein